MKPLTVDSLADLRPLSNDSRRRWPLAVLAAVLVTALLGWWLWPANQPSSLDEARLVGTRAPGCLRVILANDVSGSMRKFSAPRQGALRQLLAWAPENLRADDELAVVDFSGTAIVTMAPRSIASGSAAPTTPDPSDGTMFDELMATVAGLRSTPCSSALVLLSDGIFTDLPADPDSARAKLVAARVQSLTLLVPGSDVEVEDQWSSRFPYAPATRFDGTDPDRTGLAIGRALGKLTGQRLESTS